MPLIDDSTPTTTPERLALSEEAAKNLAETIRREPDPFNASSATPIAPSLLSAEHIENYVLKTGLISPFYLDGGDDGRLKKASYEGRIGDHAYQFDDKAEIVSVPFQDDSLVVPANSIVFVECDLEFRLPQYIAIRFNLQIRHVHRGLLLGTGPLVDPGYWGKLCIPLHNLTDENYSIPLTDGLIWVEFTKTTSDSDHGRIALEKDGKEHWDVLPLLRKASQPFDKNKPRVGIRSSIPSIITDAKSDADKAMKASEEAFEKADSAEDSARKVKNIATIAAVVVVIGVLALWGTYFFGMLVQYNTIRTQISSFRQEIGEDLKRFDKVLQQKNIEQTEILKLRAIVKDLESKLGGQSADSSSSSSPTQNQ